MSVYELILYIDKKYIMILLKKSIINNILTIFFADKYENEILKSSDPPSVVEMSVKYLVIAIKILNSDAINHSIKRF